MLYSNCKKIRNKYLECNSGKIMLGILSQLCSQYFENGDVLPSKVTIKINLKTCIMEIYNYLKKYAGEDGEKLPVDTYALSLMLQVLYDLQLEYNSVYVVGKHIFEYTVEVSFTKDAIQSLQNT